jgi:uncharacterized protein YjcR
MVKIDWRKARLDYVTDESMSYVKIAEKYKLNESTVKRHALKNGWVDLRQATLQRATELLPEKAGEQIANFQAEKLKIGKALIDASMTALEKEGNKPNGFKQVREGIVSGYKIATEAMGLDKPNTQINLNQQNNFLTLDQLFLNIEKRAGEEK